MLTSLGMADDQGNDSKTIVCKRCQQQIWTLGPYYEMQATKTRNTILHDELLNESRPLAYSNGS